MVECFQAAHEAIREALRGCEEVFEKDGVLLQEVDELDWRLGYDAIDGGTIASVLAVLDGHKLVYAAAGDSCGVLAKVSAAEAAAPPSGGEAAVLEMLPEHCPSNLQEWTERIHSTGALVVYSHPAMLDGPEHLLHVFHRDGDAWAFDEASRAAAEEAGCGFKTERGDRATLLLTPEAGTYSQSIIGVTRALGDFYLQQYGVTWRPQVTTYSLEEALGPAHSHAVVCLASDGVWDLWTFEGAVASLTGTGADAGESGASAAGPESIAAAAAAGAPTDGARVLGFFEETLRKGQEAFEDQADNLTGVVVCIRHPAGHADAAARGHDPRDPAVGADKGGRAIKAPAAQPDPFADWEPGAA